MFLRLWTTGYDSERLDELERFAHDISAPMFRSLDGCLGYAYAQDSSNWVTITYWESEEAIETAKRSPEYQAVVADIGSRGFLSDDQHTTVLEITHTEMF